MRENGGRKGARKHTRKTLILVPFWFRYSLVSLQSPKLGNTVKYRVEEVRPKPPFWKHCAPKNAPGRSTVRPLEALPPRNPTWESSHFSGLDFYQANPAQDRKTSFRDPVAILNHFREEKQHTAGPTIITLHEFIVPGLIIELHYICSVCLN